MKIPSLLLAVLLGVLAAPAARAAESPRKLAFERGSAVWVASLDGADAKKIAAGASPDISPDGTKLAFNTDEPSTKLPVRHIAVADLATGKTTVFKDVPSDNSFGPAWSPDGTQLAFYVHTADDWQLGLVNADGTGFRIVKHTEPKGQTCYGAVWAPDGKSLFCQDMTAILRIGLDGAEQKRWELKKLVADGDMNSGSRLSISPDGKTLLHGHRPGRGARPQELGRPAAGDLVVRPHGGQGRAPEPQAAVRLGATLDRRRRAGLHQPGREREGAVDLPRRGGEARATQAPGEGRARAERVAVVRGRGVRLETRIRAQRGRAKRAG